MKEYKLITLCLLVSLCIDFGICYPTFGNEYVHIKVHVPKEEDSALHSLPAHKVVTHHYHRRRRPSKKSKHNAALVESIILAEVNKPTISSDHLEYINHGGEIAEHISKPVETYVVKQEHVRPKKVNTYTFVEEIKKIPSDHYSAHDHDDDHHSYHHAKEHVDTFEVIKSKPSYHSNAFDNYPHTETFKIEDLHTHGSGTTYHHTDFNHNQLNAVKDDYHYNAAEPHHTKTVKIVETKVPSHSSYDHHGHYHGPSVHTDSIEIVKTKTPTKSTNYYNGHYHSDDDDDDSYNYARPSVDSDAQSNHNHHHQHNDNGVYSAPFESSSKYPNSYRYEHSTDDIAYTLGHDQLPPTDSYLPTKISNSQNSYRYHDNFKQNTLFDDEVLTKTGGDINHGYKYNSPNPIVDAQWPTGANSFKASETYTGVDSYSVGHVQGIGSSGYNYPSPYP